MKDFNLFTKLCRLVSFPLRWVFTHWGGPVVDTDEAGVKKRINEIKKWAREGK